MEAMVPAEGVCIRDWTKLISVHVRPEEGGQVWQDIEGAAGCGHAHSLYSLQPLHHVILRMPPPRLICLLKVPCMKLGILKLLRRTHLLHKL